MLQTDDKLPREILGLHLHGIFQRIGVIVIEDVIKLLCIEGILVP